MIRSADTARPNRLIVLLAIAMLLATAVGASFAQTQEAAAQSYRQLVGDWVGTCEQTTDGEQTENKYFHASIKETSPNVFASTFTYYKSDGATDKPVQIGATSVVSTVQPDGTIKNEIKGDGTVLVENKPKQQSYTLSESLTAMGSDSFTGKANGKISVSGLPLGLGKNGRITDGKSTYVLKGDLLTINQKVTASFKVLLVKKSYDINFVSQARRGSDVAALMRADRVAAKTPPVAPKGS